MLRYNIHLHWIYSHTAEEPLLHENIEELKLTCGIFHYHVLSPYNPQEDILSSVIPKPLYNTRGGTRHPAYSQDYPAFGGMR